jgi:hypothetical protein
MPNGALLRCAVILFHASLHPAQILVEVSL